MRRLLIAAGITAALSVPVAVFATVGTAESSSAAAAQYAPSNTGAPTIAGTAQEGNVLNANAGTWSSSSAITYAYQWQRCNSTGTACANIGGAAGQTYTVTAPDVNNRLRVVVTAKNADGTATANSAPTAVVTAKSAQGGTTGQTMAIADVALPNRLSIDDVKFSPSIVRTKGPITARFHVKEIQTGKSVSGALVYAIGLPYSRVTVPAETQTGADGWAQVTFNPDRFFPRKGYITFFVRARKPGGDLLAGVSTRRLVQVTINR